MGMSADAKLGWGVDFKGRETREEGDPFYESLDSLNGDGEEQDLDELITAVVREVYGFDADAYERERFKLQTAFQANEITGDEYLASWKDLDLRLLPLWKSISYGYECDGTALIYRPTFQHVWDYGAKRVDESALARPPQADIDRLRDVLARLKCPEVFNNFGLLLMAEYG